MKLSRQWTKPTWAIPFVGIDESIIQRVSVGACKQDAVKQPTSPLTASVGICLVHKKSDNILEFLLIREDFAAILNHGPSQDGQIYAESLSEMKTRT